MKVYFEIIWSKRISFGRIQLTKVNGIIKRFHTELYKVSHSILEPEGKSYISFRK